MKGPHYLISDMGVFDSNASYYREISWKKMIIIIWLGNHASPFCIAFALH